MYIVNTHLVVKVIDRFMVIQLIYVCNTFTPQIKGSFWGLNVMYHNHSSPGVLQLPWCATTSQWNVVQLPIGMHIHATISTGML